MKNPNELKRMIVFQSSECDAMAEYLEDMALQGWKLKSIRTSMFYFEKIEPQRLHYSVVVYAKGSMYDTIPDPSSYEFLDYCGAAGWQFVCTVGLLHVFVSEWKNPTPIETDAEIKLKTVIRGMVKQNWLAWFLLPAIFTFNIAVQLLSFAETVTTNKGLFISLLYAFVVVLTLYQIGKFLVWKTKQERRLKNGEPIQYGAQRNQKSKTIGLFVPAMIMMAIISVFLVVALRNQDYMYVFAFGLPLLLIPAVFLLSHRYQRKARSRSENKAFPFILAGAITILIIVIVFVGVGLTERKAAPVAPLVSSSGTFLASAETYYCISKYGFDTTFTVFRSRYDFILRWYLNSEMRKPYITGHEEETRQEWGAKEVHFNRRTLSAYVVYDDYIIIYCPTEFEAITRAIAEEVLGTSP